MRNKARQIEEDRAKAQARWDAVPAVRKDALERFLAAHRANPLGPTLR